MENTYEQEMNTYFIQLNDDEKKSIVLMLKTFLQGRIEKNVHISIEQYNRELEQAEHQIEAGNYVTQEDLEKEMEAW